MAIAFIGIGSNIGNKYENFRKAIDLFQEDIKIKVLATSSFYLTKPVGGPPQKDYLNGVLKIETGHSPKKLLDIIKRIEKGLGRKKTQINGPRIIDLDILIFDDKIMNDKDLIVPHPRMHERFFVLKGFSEIASELIHPVKKKTIKHLLTAIESNYENNL